jgi:hypothetical protein
MSFGDPYPQTDRPPSSIAPPPQGYGPPGQTPQQIVVTVPAAQPKGPPTRNFFNIGIIGAILLVLGTIMIAIFFCLVILSEPFGDPDFWRGYSVTSVALIGVGCLIIGIGFYGFYHNYGQSIAIASLVFAILAAIFWFIVSGIISGMEYADDSEISAFAGALILGIIFSGIMLIVQGVNVYMARFYTGYQGLSTLQGVFSIITGAFCCSIFLAIIFGIAFYMWAVSCILLIIIFFKSKLPYPSPTQPPY